MVTTFQTIGDLYSYMHFHKISPEALSKRVNISNMTLRRLLKKPHETEIPSSYKILLNGVNNFSFSDVSKVEWNSLLDQLENQGNELSDNEIKKITDNSLSKANESKLTSVLESLKSLANASLFASGKNKALAIGALIYFLNPLDCIPDAILGVGFVDDYGVLSIVCGIIGAWGVTETISDKNNLIDEDKTQISLPTTITSKI